MSLLGQNNVLDTFLSTAPTISIRIAEVKLDLLAVSTLIRAILPEFAEYELVVTDGSPLIIVRAPSLDLVIPRTSATEFEELRRFSLKLYEIPTGLQFLHSGTSPVVERTDDLNSLRSVCRKVHPHNNVLWILRRSATSPAEILSAEIPNDLSVLVGQLVVTFLTRDTTPNLVNELLHVSNIIPSRSFNDFTIIINQTTNDLIFSILSHFLVVRVSRSVISKGEVLIQLHLLKCPAVQITNDKWNCVTIATIADNNYLVIVVDSSTRIAFPSFHSEYVRSVSAVVDQVDLTFISTLYNLHTTADSSSSTYLVRPVEVSIYVQHNRFCLHTLRSIRFSLRCKRSYVPTVVTLYRLEFRQVRHRASNPIFLFISMERTD